MPRQAWILSSMCRKNLHLLARQQQTPFISHGMRRLVCILLTTRHRARLPASATTRRKILRMKMAAAAPTTSALLISGAAQAALLDRGGGMFVTMCSILLGCLTPTTPKPAVTLAIDYRLWPNVTVGLRSHKATVGFECTQLNGPYCRHVRTHTTGRLRSPSNGHSSGRFTLKPQY